MFKKGGGGFADPFLKPLWCPVFDPLLCIGWCEEEFGFWSAFQFLDVIAGVLPMGQAHPTAVGELFIKMRMDAAQSVGVPRHVNKGGFSFGQAFDGIVSHHLVVTPKAFGEGNIACAGKPDDFQTFRFVPRHQEGDPDGRFAGGA